MQKTGLREALRRAEELGVPFSGPLLTLEGDGALLLERHRGVIEYTDTRVVLAAGLYTLRVTGQGLTLTAMDAQAVRLRGRIDTLELLREGR
ncbi:MAG: YabP/YqfC family sporulation protein [Clostridiaceae bacterium]|nr:YabP/YqfC family sporulation protein [Clostridiaceae bacterium]